MHQPHEPGPIDSGKAGGAERPATEPAQPRSSGSFMADVPAIVPYAAPMFAYVALGALEGYLPKVDGQASPFWYPLAYAGKLVVVVLLAWHYRSTWSDFRPLSRAAHLALAIACGVLVWALWVALDGHYPTLKMLGERTGFDPTALKPPARLLFVAVRLLGLVVVVPVIEELFWRSFLMRWFIDPDFGGVPVGRVTPASAALVSVFFALVHPEWLPALLTGFLWAGLLWKTGSLSACAVSHATANLALGFYVLATGDWKYW
jgi:uncharacterized protein